MVQELDERIAALIKPRLALGAALEALEDREILTEFLDWGRCLNCGLQNENVWLKCYESYNDAAKKRNETLAKRLDELLKPVETGILFMREGYPVQFPADIEVFYVAPPALDEIKRWLREPHPHQPPEQESRRDNN